MLQRSILFLYSDHTRGRWDHDHFSIWVPCRIQSWIQLCRIYKLCNTTLGWIWKEGFTVFLQVTMIIHVHILGLYVWCWVILILGRFLACCILEFSSSMQYPQIVFSWKIKVNIHSFSLLSPNRWCCMIFSILESVSSVFQKIWYIWRHDFLDVHLFRFLKATL